MNLIAIPENDFREIKKELAEIKNIVSQVSRPSTLGEQWLDVSDVCVALNISKRCCQNWRDQGILPFTQLGGKIYFKASDIDANMMKNYVSVKKK
jgi:hypothetical protein